MPKSTRPCRGGKPHPDFRLFRHASGRWCKRIRAKFFYFGKVAHHPEGVAARPLRARGGT